MRRKSLLALFVLILVITAIVLSASAGKDYHADRYDVTWDVQEDGALIVTESVVFRFEGGPFTYVYRELPQDYSDGIVDIRATLDGMLALGGGGGGSGRDSKGTIPSR